MTGRGRTVRRVVLAFGVTSLLTMALTAQLPDWTPAGTEPALQPGPLGPPPPSTTFSVDQRPVEVALGDGLSVRAWVTGPRTAGLVPGVVLVPGAGSATRDRMLPTARALAAAGVASISVDKRRPGYAAWSRDFDRLAADAVAAAETLAAAPGVDPDRIGILGHSEGGWIAPLALQRAPDRFGFLVLSSAPVVTPYEQSTWLADRRLAAAPTWLRRIPALTLAGGRTTMPFLDADVRPALAGITVPIYAAWGQQDAVVPVNVAVRRLRAATSAPVDVRIVAGAGHGLAPESGWLTSAAAWMSGPRRSAPSLTGVEPDSDRAVATVPTPTALQHPAVQAGISLVLALLVTGRSGGRRHSTGPAARGGGASRRTGDHTSVEDSSGTRIHAAR